tara:strand:- start:128 stop:853 length:726 start_codon:yes stop_codon:yes gene_type:complete
MTFDINKKKFNQYLDNQNFNIINKYLHNIRYKYLFEITDIYQRSVKRKLKILDIGCGDAHVFDVLNNSFDIDYIGIDKSPRFIEHLELKKQNYDNFKYISDIAHNHKDQFYWADMIISLETLEHVPDDHLESLISEIGKAKPDIFLSSVPNEVGPILWLKNLYSYLVNYDRHIEYTFKDTFFSGLGLFHFVRKHTAGHRGFDWRNLHTIINKHYTVSNVLTSPYKFMPTFASPSIFFLCKK